MVEILAPRDVPLGGLRALTVRRTLPARTRSFVGAWCFVDHYGPTAVGVDGARGMDVAPHPHTGLQTVSWLFQGVIEHRDSGGVVGLVRPGEVNLMTAGHGIAHSEVSTAETTLLHGVQLWVALPERDRDTVRGFEHHVPEPVGLADGAGTVRVFLGDLPGVASSPVRTFTPLLGAQLELAPDAVVRLAVDPAYEHAILVDAGAVTIDETSVAPAELACLDPGREQIELRVGDSSARLILLGGVPFTEEIVMWWNFVGRSHEEIVAFREAWEAGADRFGVVDGYVGETERIPAPALPGVRLRSRNRSGRLGG